MNPASLIPLAEPIPIHWAWFDVLLITTFAAHVLFMNAMLGSAAIGLAEAVRGRDGLIRAVGMKLPPLLALTINLGVAPLLFLQVNYGNFDYVSSVLMGGWWLAVIFVLLYSYYGFYLYKFKYESMGPGMRLALFGSSVLGLVYVGFMFSNNMTLMLRPDGWQPYFDGYAGFLNWRDPAIYPRFLHMMVGALAVGGLFVALLGNHLKNEEFQATGMWWFTRGTMVNLAVGVWFLMALPDKVLLAFMGGNLPATLTLVAGLASAAVLLYAGFRLEPMRVAGWAAVTVFLMAFIRHWVRVLYLEPWFSMDSVPVTNQYGSFYLFLGFVAGGGAIIAYMLKLYFKSRQGRA
ncbi:hypothetical protein [Pseudodesulfovibrio karagichevae]|uniref:Uncharacterized protein n=1 Tax=Pseudodesulfovibrio karagichevae TaxID=3239305 RepID=A0ABV4K391_9BACT